MIRPGWRWLERLQPQAHQDYPRRGSRLLGVVAAGIIATVANSLGAKFDHRWDFTTDRRYTPSATLRHILDGLTETVTIVVLLGRSDPVAPTVEQLLSSYRLLNPRLVIDWVDPDRDPVRFLARQSELGLGAGRTEAGQVTSDAVVVVVARNRRYYIEARDVVGLDPDNSESTSHFEHAVAVALNTLFDHTAPLVCFTSGHRELSTEDPSPVGLSRLKERLERDAMSTKTVDLANVDQESLSGCRLVIVAAPDAALSPNAVHRLTDGASRFSLLLLGGVVPNSAGQLTSVGLQPLAALGGITLGSDVVVELNDAYRLPNVFGETFLAKPLEHPTTRGLLRGDAQSPLRVVVSLAQSLQKQPGSQALPLLESSADSVRLTDVSQQAVGRAVDQGDNRGSRTVAMAAPLQGESEALRLAVAPANIVQNRSFESPSLLVTQAFALSLISWLVASKATTVEFTPRPSRAAGLELSAEELSDIARYTGLVMPGCVLLAGISILLMRRKSTGDAQERDRGSG